MDRALDKQGCGAQQKIRNFNAILPMSSSIRYCGVHNINLGKKKLRLSVCANVTKYCSDTDNKDADIHTRQHIDIVFPSMDILFPSSIN